MDRVCEKGPILVNGKNLKKTSTTFWGKVLYSLLIGDFPAPLRLLSPHIFKLRFAIVRFCLCRESLPRRSRKRPFLDIDAQVLFRHHDEETNHPLRSLRFCAES